MKWLLPVFVGLSACGGTASSGQLSNDTTVSSSRWVALDLANGSVTPVPEPVEAGDPRWHGTTMLFRELDPGQATVGRALADPLAELDEYPRRKAGHGRVWIAANELNQVQWRTMANSEPWFAVLPVADQRSYVWDTLPAFGLTPEAAETACAGLQLDGWTMDLPTGVEWEQACTADTTTRFSWGDDLDPAIAAASAVCDATAPQPIGARQANRWGLHDMHGNVWELATADGRWEARGGGWDQGVATARSSNRMPIGLQATGWAIGLRPVLRR